MAEVRAFRGIRYDAARVGDLSEVVCAPYDIITPAAQAECYARSEYNAVRVELAREEPGDDAGQNRYTRAAAQLRGWLRAAALRHEASPSLYVYEESFVEGGRSLARLGFFGAVRLEEWDRRIVLPHEWTMPKPRADRLSLLRACRANLSPIFGLYEDPRGRIGEQLAAARRAAPVAEVHLRPGAVAAAAAVHRLWRLDDPESVAVIRRELADRALYIADGHHRYETALEYSREVRQAGGGPDHPANWVMMLLVSLEDPGLVVLPTHRLVKAPRLDRPAFLRELRQVFTVEEIADRSSDGAALTARLAALGQSPEPVHAFGVVGLDPQVGHVVTVRPGLEVDRRLPADRSAAWRGLDVAVLHSLVLEGLLGLGSEASGEGVTYTRDAAQAVSAVRDGECDLAFLLNPTRVAQIRDVALAGDRMPEKSTYFWPKPPTGLVFYDHEVPGTLG